MKKFQQQASNIKNVKLQWDKYMKTLENLDLNKQEAAKLLPEQKN